MKIMIHSRNVCAMISATMLFGCAGMMRSDFAAPRLEIPQSWQKTTLSGDVALDPWWHQFHNPELNRLIDDVLSTNNDLALATLTLRRARLQAGISRTDLYPRLSSNSTVQRAKTLTAGSDAATSYSTNLSVSYELDLWGRVGATVDSAQWNAMASLEDRESTAQALVATTASLYWQIGYLKQRLVLAQNSIAYAQQTLALTERQFQSGAVSRLNVLEAQRSLASQQASQSQLQQQLTEAENAFSLLFNQPPGAVTAQIEHLPATPLPDISPGVPADLLVRRPDVKSALYALRSALASKDATFAQYLPTLTLTGSVGDSSDQLKTLLRDPVGTLGAGLVLPFLQWNEMELNKKIAEVDYQSAVVSYRQTLYQAFADVNNAISARRQYIFQGQQLEQQYDAAEAAEKIYESQYRAGAVSIQDWLDAQNSRRVAEESLLENHYNQLVAQATLYQSLGGSDVAPPLPTPQ